MSYKNIWQFIRYLTLLLIKNLNSFQETKYRIQNFTACIKGLKTSIYVKGLTLFALMKPDVHTQYTPTPFCEHRSVLILRLNMSPCYGNVNNAFVVTSITPQNNCSDTYWFE